MHGWECLPPPCLLAALRHVTPADRRACRSVCRLWSPIASASVTAVHLALPLPTTNPTAATAALAHALAPFPRAPALHLTLSGTTPPTPLTALLAALAASPTLAHISHLTLAAPSLTTALPLLSLRALSHLSTLTLHAPHSPHVLAHLTASFPHLTAIHLDPKNLTTPPTNHTVAHLIPPLRHTLASLSLPLSTTTSDAALHALPPLTRLMSLTLTCGRHLATSAGLAALAPLTHLRHFSASNLIFHSIPSALTTHPHRMHPGYAPLIPDPAAPTWPAALTTVLKSWTQLEIFQMSETDLDPLVLAALPNGPPSLKAVTLDLRYTSRFPPPTAAQAALLAACPSLSLVLEPHRDHALSDYQPLLEACPNLHSLSLLGITLDAAVLRTLQAAPALRHLSLHFHSAAQHPLGPAHLSAALLAPLASMLHLASLHISAPPHLAPSLAHLLHDPALPLLLEGIPLRSLSLTTQTLAAARAATDARILAVSPTTVQAEKYQAPGQCAVAAGSQAVNTLGRAIDSAAVATTHIQATVAAVATTSLNAKAVPATAALAVQAGQGGTAEVQGSGAPRSTGAVLKEWALGAVATVREGLDGLVRAGQVQQVAVQLPGVQLNWAAAG